MKGTENTAPIEYGSLNPKSDVVAVIMAGGSGTRFWPWSRKSLPKQYLPLGQGSASLIQETIARVNPICGNSGVMVVTSQDQVPLVQEQAPGVAILAEPMARNTAACVAFAAIRVLDTVGDVPMLCLPADHLIQSKDAVALLYTQGVKLAREEEVLITFGIRPVAPVTGYGYIHAGPQQGLSGAAQQVKAFVEKPDRETAEQYLLSGEYFWNSGMFVWRPSVILAAIRDFVPKLAVAIEELRQLLLIGGTGAEVENLYKMLPSVSIDVGVMERASNVKMLVGDNLGWSDVGSWESWLDSKSVEVEADAFGNQQIGDALLIDSKNCSVVAEDRFVAVIGAEDLIVVDGKDALLVCNRSATQDVKKVVEFLTEKQRFELL